MTQKKIDKIITQLEIHERRLDRLEGNKQSNILRDGHICNKEMTLRELVKGKEFDNGQQQVAAIVGYFEKVLGRRIPKDKIKEEWSNAKMKGGFAAMYFSRAKDDLTRVLSDGTCDLTQSGEYFFEQLSKK